MVSQREEAGHWCTARGTLWSVIAFLPFTVGTVFLSHSCTRQLPFSRQSNTRQTLTQRCLNMLGIVLRLLLYPLRWLIAWIFAGTDEFDGLSDAVTAKAAQQFVTYLQTMAKQNTTGVPGNNRTLADAWVSTGFQAAKEQALATHSLVLVYLHSPLHRESDRFCRDVLCHPLMRQFLSQPHVLALGVSIHTAQGAHLATTLQATAYPLLALLHPQSATALHMLLRAEGAAVTRMSAESLSPYLQVAWQRQQHMAAELETRRLLREQEQELRRQQDEEYQQTLLADQERERIRREEQDEILQTQREEELRQQREVEQTEQALASAKAQLGPEPESGGAVIRFVLPSGAKLNRRFASDETIATLKAFLKVHFHDSNVGIERVALSTNFPRKTYEDDSVTLAEADLTPQAVLMVQDLDA